MKKINVKVLSFDKNSIVELNDAQQMNVKGGITPLSPLTAAASSVPCGAAIAAISAAAGAVVASAVVAVAGAVEGAIDEAFGCDHK